MCLIKTPEGIAIGFHFFAWAPKSQKEEDSNEKRNSGTPPTTLINPILTGKWANFKYIPGTLII